LLYLVLRRLHSGRPNSLVLFEELGGNPSGIQLMSISMEDK
jgi:hypothetical protein